MDIIEFLTSSSVALIAVFTPIILALVQVIKNFVESSRWAPIFSIVIGIVLAPVRSQAKAHAPWPAGYGLLLLLGLS